MSTRLHSPRFPSALLVVLSLSPLALAPRLAQAQITGPLPILPKVAPAPTSPSQSVLLVRVEVFSRYAAVHPGQKTALAVILNVADGWHLYANPKRGEFGKDTVITPQPSTLLKFGKVQYPPGEYYEDKTLKASNHIYKGQVICYIPLELLASASGAMADIRVNLKLDGQLCSNTGTCRLWSDAATAHLTIAAPGQLPEPSHSDLFTAFDANAAWQTPTQVGRSWLASIALALAAGLIMNVMPCVLPVIPIIVLTLIRQSANEQGRPDRGKSLRSGLAFAAGILLIFAALALVMSIFKLLWGQQFQSNGFKFALLLIVLVLSLSMFGMFDIALPPRLSNIQVVRRGYLGTFAMGMLATLLATPCGAPLLTPVLAWSLAQPLVITVVVFLLIGAGMAAPYVLLTAFPSLLGRVPHAGNWMLRLKQALGFLMLLFAGYLICVFPPGWHRQLIYFCLLMAFCVWLGLSVVNRATPAPRRRAVRLIALVLLAAGAVALALVPKNDTLTSGEPWGQQLARYRQEGRTVLVKFTANWCTNCAILDKIVYQTAAFRDRLVQTGAALIIADASFSDPEIDQMIRALGGPGQALPFAALFPGGDPDSPILLRDLYSLNDALAALDQAHRRQRTVRPVGPDAAGSAQPPALEAGSP